MNQLDRIEAMLLNQGRLLVALADMVGAAVKSPGHLDMKAYGELHKAIADVAPWRRT